MNCQKPVMTALNWQFASLPVLSGPVLGTSRKHPKVSHLYAELRWFCSKYMGNQHCLAVQKKILWKLSVANVLEFIWFSKPYTFQFIVILTFPSNSTLLGYHLYCSLNVVASAYFYHQSYLNNPSLGSLFPD